MMINIVIIGVKGNKEMEQDVKISEICEYFKDDTPRISECIRIEKVEEDGIRPINVTQCRCC